jgi:hypothetical protein
MIAAVTWGDDDDGSYEMVHVCYQSIKIARLRNYETEV